MALVVRPDVREAWKLRLRSTVRRNGQAFPGAKLSDDGTKVLVSGGVRGLPVVERDASKMKFEFQPVARKMLWGNDEWWWVLTWPKSRLDRNARAG